MVAKDEGFVALTRYASEEEARSAAARLLEAGIPPMVEVAGEGEGSGSHEGEGNVFLGKGSVELLVLPGDAARARQVLGLPEPEPAPGMQDVDEEFEAKRQKNRQTMLFVALYLAALIIIPLVAFWLTVTLAD